MHYRKNIVTGTSIFSFALLIAISTYFMSLGDCPTGSFACDNGTICLPQKLLCNSHVDCQDWSDEMPVLCGDFLQHEMETSEKSFERAAIRKIELNMTQEQFHAACDYDKSSYPKGCGCGQFTWLICINAKFKIIPKSFPGNVSGLILKRNQINLKQMETLDYPMLTYLEADHNNISMIPSGFFNKTNLLRKLFLNHNQIEELSPGCFSGLKSLIWLYIDSNKLRDFDLSELSPLEKVHVIYLSDNYLKLENSRFPALTRLRELYLDGNLIESIDSQTYQSLKRLRVLTLTANKIKLINSKTFEHMTELRELRLSDNPIMTVADDTFKNLKTLGALYLDNIISPLNSEFFSNVNVSYLSLRGFKHEKLDFDGISSIKNLKFVIYERFSFCVETPHVKNCRPNSDGVSSLNDLLTKPTLRYAAWLMVLVTCFGNGMVLWGRFRSRDENRSVSVVIRNLAVADLMMGFYLLIIGIQDWRYRDTYLTNSHAWMKSWECTTAGILAMVSSEVSMLILAFMSIERFLLIADPFGGHRHLNSENIMMSLFIIWIAGLAIAVFPAIFWRSSSKFYGNQSGTCFPLFIQEKFSLGWQYSAFVFLGINLILLLLISTLYSALLFSIWKTRRATPLNIFDYEFAVRFFFIVLTDSACWVPIIASKIMVFINFEISADMYAWLVIFILPLNSAVNPLLYTFTTPKYRDQIFTNLYRGSASKRREGFGHSNQESQESNGKIIPLLTDNSNWKI